MCYHLEDIVNVSDFIELGTLMRMFEVDTLEYCVDKLRSQTAVGMGQPEQLARVKDSINAKYT